jgi:hypothetical protein
MPPYRNRYIEGTSMNFYYINFADKKYSKARSALTPLYRNYGFECIEYGPEDADQFIIDNGFSLNERIYGYGCWKPYIILKTLEMMEDGDIVLYTDACDLVLSNPKDIIQEVISENGLMVVQGDFRHADWTKRDCFHVMDCDSPEFHNAKQLESGICAFVKNDYSKQVLSEWQKHNLNYNAASDDVEFFDNYEGFVDHRHDQSILTNVILKMGANPIHFNRIRNYFQYDALKYLCEK